MGLLSLKEHTHELHLSVLKYKTMISLQDIF